MYNVGQKVTAAQALPADLIFYGPQGTTTVAMFLGNNQMLEVTDAGVVVSPVRTTGYGPVPGPDHRRILIRRITVAGA